MSITVKTAATDHKLTSVSQVKDEMGISGTSDDTFIDHLIDEISDAITSYTDRVFAEEKVEERVPGHDHPDLIVSRTPIQSIDTIKFNDDTTIDSGDYFISDKDAGFIRRDNAVWDSTRKWRVFLTSYRPPISEELDWWVTYTGGYVLPNWSGTRNLPYDVERACIEGVKARFLARQRDPNLTMLNVNNQEFMGRYTQLGLPDTAIQLLKPYVRVM